MIGILPISGLGCGGTSDETTRREPRTDEYQIVRQTQPEQNNANTLATSARPDAVTERLIKSDNPAKQSLILDDVLPERKPVVAMPAVRTTQPERQLDVIPEAAKTESSMPTEQPSKPPIEAPRFIPPPPAPPSADQVARVDPQSQLHHARFLIKAGLVPLAKDSLQEIIEESPGTPIAIEAQRTLESLTTSR